MKDGLYATHSRRIIRERLAEAQQLGLEGKARLDFINDGYAWGPRDFWPYKVWLREFKSLVGCGPTGQPAKTKAGKLAAEAIAAGQSTLPLEA